jgi:hypothetical protein
MHDTLRPVQGGSAAERLGVAFGLNPAQAEEFLRAVDAELTWHLEQITLSRAGLADVVDVLGDGDFARHADAGADLKDAAAHRDGTAILAGLLGPADKASTLAARAGRRAGVSLATAEALLPPAVATLFGAFADRTRHTLAGVLAQIPPLGRLGTGNPYRDLAGILRRRCGAGVYSPRTLLREVRRALARAAGFQGGGVLLWYPRFMLGRLAARSLRSLLARR